MIPENYGRSSSSQPNMNLPYVITRNKIYYFFRIDEKIILNIVGHFNTKRSSGA